MKRIVILIIIALVSAGMLCAEEAILIDFSILTADIRVPINQNDQETVPNQNRHTMMDYGSVAGGSFRELDRSLMRTSLAIQNWEVVFNASSRRINNIERSFTREAASRQWGTVLGVRVHYPIDPAFSKATIRPPFEIPAFEPSATVLDDGTIEYDEGATGINQISRFEAQEAGGPAYGIVKNVGTIRSVAVNAYGLNFPHGLNVILIDELGDERLCFMGYLNFDGWRELTWTNPQYITEVRNRDLRLVPLYPFRQPFIRFGGFRLDRDADAIGGDFIAYFKDVKLIYDKAVLDTDRDIEDEDVWHIIYERETARKIHEMERFGHTQILRFLDSQRQAQEVFNPLHREFGFTPTPTYD